MAGIRADNDGLRTLVWRFLHFASGRRAGDAISGAGMLPFWLTALFTITRFLGPSRPHGPPCLP